MESSGIVAYLRARLDWRARAAFFASVLAVALAAPISSGAQPLPMQPLIAEPPPNPTHELPFGRVTVTPTAIIGGAPDQKIKVAVTAAAARSVPRNLLVRMRPARDPTAARSRGDLRLAVRTGRLSLQAGRSASLEFSNLDPPAGRYTIDFLRGDSGTPPLGSVPVVVYGQHRLPPGTDSGAAPLAESQDRLDDAQIMPSGARALVGDGINNNVSSMAGYEAETYVAVNPDNKRRVIAAVNRVNSWVSDDQMRPGTSTYNTLPRSTLLPTAEGGGTTDMILCCDPALAADRLGNFWYAVIASEAYGRVVINRMAAGTTVFHASNVAIPRNTGALQDKPMITIDNWPASPNYGMLYAVWIQFGTPPDGDEQVVISRCKTRLNKKPKPEHCDEPDNWSQPVAITDDASSAIGSYTYPAVAAAPNGDVYVVWWDYSNDNDIEIDRCLAGSDCGNANGWGPDRDVDNLNRSGGTPVPLFCSIPPAPTGRVGPAPYVDVDFEGRVYVSFSDLRNNGVPNDGTTKCGGTPSTEQTFDSFIARGASPNTFPADNSGIRLSDDGPLAHNHHFFPTLTADPSTGEVQSSLYSTKADPDHYQTHQYVVTSTDHGATYSAMQQITTAPSDYLTRGGSIDQGDYEGADSAQGQLFAVWADDRTAHGGDSEMYMYSSPPQTTITSGPTGTTADTTPTFTFSSTSFTSALGKRIFQCSVDGGTFIGCASPKTIGPLSNGAHTFAVRTRYTDSVKNRIYLDPSPASRNFSVSSAAR
jgi:hypothetical protein